MNLKSQSPKPTYKTYTTQQKGSSVGSVGSYLRKKQEKRPYLSQLKALLNHPDPSTMPDDLREEWEERAAIMEFDGVMSRARAEYEAWKVVSKNSKNLIKTASEQ
jgi:hypothetical protein